MTHYKENRIMKPLGVMMMTPGLAAGIDEFTILHNPLAGSSYSSATIIGNGGVIG